MKTTRIEIINVYNEIKQETGKLPTRKSLIEKGISRRQISNHFGTLQNLQIEVDGTCNKQKFVPESINCLVCGKEASTSSDNKTRVYCSKACSNTITKVKHGKYVEVGPNKLITNCIVCEVELYGGKSFCGYKCRMIDSMSRKTIQDMFYSTTRYNANKYDKVRQTARIFSKYYKKPECEICGYDKHYEVCHIKPISSFPDNTPLLEVNSIDNLIHLCPNHHWEFDKGLIKISKKKVGVI